MKKFLLLMILMNIIIFGIFAEGEREKGYSSNAKEFFSWGDGISEIGKFEGLTVQDIQKWFPGGIMSYEGWFTNYDDINHIHTGNLYIIKLTHKNLGPVLFICPDAGEYFFMEDYLNHSFFMRLEKQYFNKEDYFQLKEFNQKEVING